MNDTLEIIFGLFGGLAIFIYGMNLMSECLQKAAGERMKQILGLLTRNRLMGVVAGALVTAVLQSSSATTVMAIGFVSAGLMSLPQAISIIFGANIGTTITA
ncbi:MAG: Na/Pi symporter, partial [Clostridiales bacterium]|nr:Na/Pi symporter [Clostridiales bacterium]